MSNNLNKRKTREDINNALFALHRFEFHFMQNKTLNYLPSFSFKAVITKCIKHQKRNYI